MNLKYIWSSVMDYINNTLTGQIIDFYHISFGFVTTLSIIICFLIMLVYIVKVVANKDIYTQKDMAVKGGIGIFFFVFIYIILKSFVIGGENIYFLNLYLVSEDAVSNSEYGKSHYGGGDYTIPDRKVSVKGENYYYDLRETMIDNIDIIYKTKLNISDLDIYKKYPDTTDLTIGLEKFLKSEEKSFSGIILGRYAEIDSKYSSFLIKEGDKYYILPVFLTSKLLSLPSLGTDKLYSKTSISTGSTNNTQKDSYIYKAYRSIYPNGVGNEIFNNIENYYKINGNSFSNNYVNNNKNLFLNNYNEIKPYLNNEKIRMYIFYYQQINRNKENIANQQKILLEFLSYFNVSSYEGLKNIISQELGGKDIVTTLNKPIENIDKISRNILFVTTSELKVNNIYDLTNKEASIIALLKEMEIKGDFKGIKFTENTSYPNLTNEQQFKSYLSNILGIDLDEKDSGLLKTNSFGEGAKLMCEKEKVVSYIFKKYGYNFNEILSCGENNSFIKNLEGFEKIISNLTRTSMIDFKKNKIDFSYFVMHTAHKICGSGGGDILNCRILLGNNSSLISPFWLYEKVATKDTNAINNVAINLYNMQDQFISTKDEIYRWNFFVNNSFFKKVYSDSYIAYSKLGVWSVIDPLLFLILKFFNYIISIFGLLCIVYFYKKII